MLARMHWALGASLCATAFLAALACAPTIEDTDLCANLIDDDDDGLVDCDDPTCVLSGACGGCGDGVVDSSIEACDDGGHDDGDGCDADCRKEGCGDGVRSGDEECDDGNLVPGDGCSFACLVDRCGDGRVQAEERCDDGNLRPGDGCDASCDYERPPHCGDGLLDFDEGELCDDGGLADNDGCNGACRNEFCGDGRAQTFEQCDDGNEATNDDCCFCQLPFCGNFFVCGRDEQCDDGNSFGGDGCSATCRFE